MKIAISILSLILPIISLMLFIGFKKYLKKNEDDVVENHSKTIMKFVYTNLFIFLAEAILLLTLIIFF